MILEALLARLDYLVLFCAGPLALFIYPKKKQFTHLVCNCISFFFFFAWSHTTPRVSGLWARDASRLVNLCSSIGRILSNILILYINEIYENVPQLLPLNQTQAHEGLSVIIIVA